MRPLCIHIYREDIETMDMNEIKYLVFESHLLGLFTQYRSCHQHCTDKIAHQLGSLVCVKQECSHCRYIWTWNSQPFIKDIPAGNILLSVSILLSGSSPAKALRMLKHVNMVSIKEKDFL